MRAGGLLGAGALVDEKGLPPHGLLPAGSGEDADGFPNNNSDKTESTSGTITYTGAIGQPGTYTSITGLSSLSSSSTTIDTIGTAGRNACLQISL